LFGLTVLNPWFAFHFDQQLVAVANVKAAQASNNDQKLI
jgi:hypothetical protein